MKVKPLSAEMVLVKFWRDDSRHVRYLSRQLARHLMDKALDVAGERFTLTMESAVEEPVECPAGGVRVSRKGTVTF